MTAQLVTIHLPETLYTRLRMRAEQHQRSVADEVLELLTATLPVADELPEDLQTALSPLQVLDDAALWQSAQLRLNHQALERLEALHHKRQREGLTEEEDTERADLLRQYERILLVRAHAAAMLNERGHDVTRLITHP